MNTRAGGSTGTKEINDEGGVFDDEAEPPFAVLQNEFRRDTPCVVELSRGCAGQFLLTIRSDLPPAIRERPETVPEERPAADSASAASHTPASRSRVCSVFSSHEKRSPRISIREG
jgi:hypothetical protein